MSSYDTGFVPEVPGSQIMIRRAYDEETNLYTYEQLIPWPKITMTPEQIREALNWALEHPIKVS